jgi:acyl-coenzyme A thioesterase PaaI-like protein
LFGLQLELEPDGERAARGRFFVKQDHQGPPGYAHGGIMATALDEAMSLLAHHVGTYPLTASLSIDLHAPAPVGAFVEVAAEVVSAEGRRLQLRSTASNEGVVLATGTAVCVEAPPPE